MTTASTLPAPVTPLAAAVAEHLTWLRVHGYATTTVHQREYHLAALVGFLAEVGINTPGEVSFAALESYQRHLYRQRNTRTGGPLSFRTQAQRLIPVKSLFAWLTKHGRIPFDRPPAWSSRRPNGVCPKRPCPRMRRRTSSPVRTSRHRSGCGTGPSSRCCTRPRSAAPS